LGLAIRNCADIFLHPQPPISPLITIEWVFVIGQDISSTSDEFVALYRSAAIDRGGLAEAFLGGLEPPS